MKFSGLTEMTRARWMVFAPLVASSLAVSGCMSGPTYGTDKTSTEQLVGDVTGILSMAPKNRGDIEYKPRPDLVKPKPGEKLNLPAPQESIVNADASQWPESPEQKRTRLRAEATENRDTPGWRPQILGDLGAPSSSSVSRPGVTERTMDSGVEKVGKQAEQRAAFNQRLAETKQGSPTTRKFLSEPPLTYREPSATAPVGDVGEDEVKKERRLKAQATKKTGNSWRDVLPW